jgi:uncharacterized protein YceK
MKKILLLIAAIGLFSGCASTRWYKDGASQEDFANQKEFCVLYARATNDNTTWSRGFTEGVAAKQCMEEHGWSRVPASN